MAPGSSYGAAAASRLISATTRPTLAIARPRTAPGGTQLLLACVALCLVNPAVCAGPFLEFNSGPRDLEIPDASLEGVFDTQIVASPLQQVSDLRVSLHLDPGPDGAFAGDLYLTLVHADRVAVLLNRPGKDSSHPLGYPDSGGFSVTFSDPAPAGDIHRYHDSLSPGLLPSASAPLEGLWQPDGRLADPRIVSHSTPRTALLSQFLGTDPNGTWTLFLADVSGGGEVRLRDWSLQFGLASVPDLDSSLPLLIVAGVATEIARRRWRRP